MLIEKLKGKHVHYLHEKMKNKLGTYTCVTHKQEHKVDLDKHKFDIYLERVLNIRITK